MLLHGRGSHEREILALADHLPAGPPYAAVRAPIAEGGGYAWFANRGIGRPVAESLRATMDWFRGWLDDVAPAGRPVVLVGFSGGAAFAGGLVLDDPARYAGAAILYGTLPFDAGVPSTPAGWPACRSSSPRASRHRHPARAARPHLGLPARRRPAPHHRRAATPAATASATTCSVSSRPGSATSPPPTKASS